MGSPKPVDVGTWYFVAYHHGLSLGPIDAFLEWRVGPKMAWAGELTASGAIAVNQPHLLGGEKDQGGVDGTLRVMFGEAGQVANSYLVSTFGDQVATWRGFATVVWEGGKYGANNPYPQKPSYKIRKTIAGWDDGICWYPEKAEISVGTYRAADNPWRYLVVDKDDVTDRSGLAFDDSVWAIGKPPFASHAWEFPGDYGFATEPATVVPVAKKVWMRTILVLAKVPETMRFQAFVDNDCKLYVNGTLVTTVGANNGAYYDVPIATDAFQEGENLIAVEGWDRHVSEYPSNFFWFDWRITMSLETKAMNPAHVLYFLRTSRERGREPIANMADANLRAAADWFHGEGFGLCGTRKAASVSPAEYEERICRIAGCSFSRSVEDGKFYIDIANGVYDLESLPILTDDDVLSFKETPTVLDNAVNSVSVRYFDPVKKQSITTPPVRALALIATFGEIHQTYDFPEVPNADLANRIALRELLASITPTRRFELDCTDAPASWRRFQYFRAQLPKRGIADMVCTVGGLQHGQLRSGGVRLAAIQDVYSVPNTAYAQPEPGVDTRPGGTPAAIVLQRVVEAPYVEVCGRLQRAELDALPDDVGFLMAVAVDPADSRDFTLFTAPAGGEYAEAGVGAFCPTATVNEAAAKADLAFTLGDGKDLAAVAVGAPALWDGELCRVDAIDVGAGTITLGRGCADTVPREHTAGSRLYFYGDAAANSATEFSDGEIVDAKLLTNTGSQQLAIAAATPLQLTFDQRQVRPYPPAKVRIAAAAWPAAVAGEFEVTWAHRDRLQQADQLVDTELASIGPEASVRYALQLFDDATDVLLVEKLDIAGATATVNLAASGSVRLVLYAISDSAESWQRHEHVFAYTTAGGADTITAETYSPPVIVHDGGGDPL